jgi:hypothetical protein
MPLARRKIFISFAYASILALSTSVFADEDSVCGNSLTEPQPVRVTSDAEIEADIETLLNEVNDELNREHEEESKKGISLAKNSAFHGKNPSYVLMHMEGWLRNESKERAELVLKAARQLIEYSDEFPSVHADIATMLARYLDSIHLLSSKLEEHASTYQDVLMFLNLHPNPEALLFISHSFNRAIPNNLRLADLFGDRYVYQRDLEALLIRGGHDLELFKPYASLNAAEQKAQTAWNAARLRYEAFLEEEVDPNDETSTAAKPISAKSAFSFPGQLAGHIQKLRLTSNEIVRKFVIEEELLETQILDQADADAVFNKLMEAYMIYPRFEKVLRGSNLKSGSHVGSLFYADQLNALGNTAMLQLGEGDASEILDLYVAGNDNRMPPRYFSDTFERKFGTLYALAFQWEALVRWSLDNAHKSVSEETLIEKARSAPRLLFEIILRESRASDLKEFALKVLQKEAL